MEDKIVSWLKLSKTAPLLGAILIIVLVTNTALDLAMKVPNLLNGQNQPTGQAQTTLNALVTTLKSTNEALEELTVSNGKIITAIHENGLMIGEMKSVLDVNHARQVTKTEFQSEIDVLKKKIDRLQK
jgi:hypothetical protein